MIRWRSTALSSIFVEMKPRPKSMITTRDLGFGVWDLERMTLDVVKSPWIMLFLWRRATCFPSSCIIVNCFFSG